MNLTFATPEALLLLVAVPLYLWLVRKGVQRLPFPRAEELSENRRGDRWLAAVPDTLRVLALAALVLAIAGPASAGSVVEERGEGVPIVLAIDVSSSMLAQDFRPRDRLDVAKSTIATFVAGRPNDPIGLVAFAADALTLVPTTTNRIVILSSLESLQVGMLEDGTAVGDGLATSINRLRVPDRTDGVVVLLSDGESNRGTIDALSAADAARALGIRVFTVGVGSDGVAPVPIGSAPAGFEYAELPVGLDEELLREIATRTGGEYFRATDADALARIYGEIDRLVPSVVETTTYARMTEWAAVLLILAGLGLASEWAIRASRWGVLP